MDAYNVFIATTTGKNISTTPHDTTIACFLFSHFFFTRMCLLLATKIKSLCKKRSDRTERLLLVCFFFLPTKRFASPYINVICLFSLARLLFASRRPFTRHFRYAPPKPADYLRVVCCRGKLSAKRDRNTHFTRQWWWYRDRADKSHIMSSARNVNHGVGNVRLFMN